MSFLSRGGRARGERGPITVITATGEDNERRNANTHPRLFRLCCSDDRAAAGSRHFTHGTRSKPLRVRGPAVLDGTSGRGRKVAP
ncbi:hypothetical protein MRX96_054394 [Rhipicephalus microplus]